MRTSRVPFIVAFAFVLVALRSSHAPNEKPASAGVSFRFERNEGQMPSEARFFAKGKDTSVYLTGQEAVVQVSRTVAKDKDMEGAASTAQKHEFEQETAVLRIRPVGARAESSMTALDPLPGKTNYFFGNDPSKWVTNVSGYGRVRYEDVYPGIDLLYYGNQEGRLEYDFVVQPGADPELISVSIEGSDDIRLDSEGDLIIQTALGEVRQKAPKVYQRYGRFDRAIHAAYTLLDDGRVAFDVGTYDASRELVIDPQLVFATLLGGSGTDHLTDVGVDLAGNIYAGGHTTSVNFPPAGAPFQSTKTSSNRSVWISKMNSTGTQLIYATYLGGTGDDPGFRFTVDSAGNAYVSGATNSTNFPTRNGFQSGGAGNYDAFLAKLSPSGDALLYSTTIGAV